KGKRERGDGVLDHDVCDIEGKRVGGDQRRHLVVRQAEGLDDPPLPLLDGELVERWNPGTSHAPPPRRVDAASPRSTQSRSRGPSTSGARPSASRSRDPVSTMAVRSPSVRLSRKRAAAGTPPSR